MRCLLLVLILLLLLLLPRLLMLLRPVFLISPHDDDDAVDLNVDILELVHEPTDEKEEDGAQVESERWVEPPLRLDEVETPDLADRPLRPSPRSCCWFRRACSCSCSCSR